MLLGCGSALAEATVGEGFALITSAVVEHLTGNELSALVRVYV